MEKALTEQELERMSFTLEKDKKGNLLYADLCLQLKDEFVNIHFYKLPTPTEIYRNIVEEVSNSVESKMKAKLAAKFFED